VDDAIITEKLLSLIKRRFRLDWDGDHGIAHWERVRQNGLAIANGTRANTRIIELFAYLHDADRESEIGDPGHGMRSAELAFTLRGTLIRLADAEFEILYQACAHHNTKISSDDITMQICWDADRLDIGRVGIIPDPKYFHTKAAQRMLVEPPATFGVKTAGAGHRRRMNHPGNICFQRRPHIQQITDYGPTQSRQY